MSNSAVHVVISERLARITFANETGLGVLDSRSCREFADAARTCTDDPTVGAILIDSAGPNFGVGADLNELVAAKEQIGARIFAMASDVGEAVRLLHNGPLPVIVAVSGLAAGGSFSLVCGADIAIAKRSARLVPAYIRSGLAPDGGGSFFLPRLVGPRRAFDIFATNQTLTAEQALGLGIVSRVVDDDRLDAETTALVQTLLSCPPGTLAALKQLLRASAQATLEDQLRSEAACIAKLAGSPQTYDLLASFVRRKHPVPPPPKGAVDP